MSFLIFRFSFFVFRFSFFAGQLNVEGDPSADTCKRSRLRLMSRREKVIVDSFGNVVLQSRVGSLWLSHRF
jgi:hypothetical protein